MQDILPAVSDLPLDLCRLIDDLCYRFERAWNHDQPPRLEDYLSDIAGTQRLVLLRELLKVELGQRNMRGESPTVTDYVARFPDCESVLRAFFTAAPAPSVLPLPIDPTLAALDENPPALPGYNDFSIRREGGMGIVWLCRDDRLNRQVAIKVMQSRGLSPGRAGMRRRFVAEAQLTSRLQHPNIPPVHETGTLPDGRPYFVMKWVAGRTLHDLLQARASIHDDLPRFLHHFEQTCQAVAFAHVNDVIHRDLKPRNIMVGAFGEVQVMDWGLAKALGNPSELDSDCKPCPSAPAEVTTEGTVLGTYAYMPPEQARGRTDLLDRRSDVFGLGAVLCEILTGKPPYSGAKAEVQAQAQRADLAPALARLSECEADAELVELARVCLSVDPAERPADAEVVADAVAAYQQELQQRLLQAELDQAATAAQAEAQARAVVAERKKRRMMVALAALLLLGTTIVGILLIRTNQAEVDKLQAEKRERQQSDVRVRESIHGAMRLALQRGAGAEALGLFHEAEKMGLDLTPGMRLDRARAFNVVSDRKNAARELEFLDRAALESPQRGVADVLYGSLLFGTNNSRANELLDRALLEKLPADERLFAQALRAGSLHQAIPLLEKAITANSGHIEARAMAALGYFLLGRPGTAAALCRESRPLAPNHPHFTLLLVLASAFDGKEQDALRQLEQIRSVFPDPGQIRTMQSLIRGITLWVDYFGKMHVTGEMDTVSQIQLRLAFQSAIPALMAAPGEGLMAFPPAFRDAAHFLVIALADLAGADWQLGLLGRSPPEATRLRFTTFQEARPIREKLRNHGDGTLLYLFAWKCWPLTQNAGPDKRADSAPQVAQVAEDCELASRTPGLLGHQIGALDSAVTFYALAGKLGDNKEWSRKAAILARRRWMTSPTPNDQMFFVLTKAALRGEDYPLAAAILADRLRQTKLPDSAFALDRAFIDCGMGAFESAKRWLEKASPQDLNAAPEEVAGLRKRIAALAKRADSR